MISNKFNYDRKRGIQQTLSDLDKPTGDNAGDSNMVLGYLQEENLNNVKYDVLMINCGLHDIRVDRESRNIQTTKETYVSNINKIIDVANLMANQLIWVTSTPFDEKIHNSRQEGFFRFNKDLLIYNEAANEIMNKKGIFILDLYSFTNSLRENIFCDHVYFKNEVRALQSAFIAGYLNNL